MKILLFDAFNSSFIYIFIMASNLVPRAFFFPLSENGKQNALGTRLNGKESATA
jgi:hypothetical protein